MRPKHIAIASTSAAAVFSFLFLLPLPYWHESTFIVQPSERVAVRAETSGFIDRIEVSEGDAVKRGAMLAKLRNFDLERKRDELVSRLTLIDREIRLNHAGGKTAEAIEIARTREQVVAELRESESRLQRLQLTSPVDGVVLTPKLGDRIGVMLNAGAEFCEIAGNGPRSIRVTVDDWDITEVRTGARATLRVNSASGIAGVRELEGRVVSVAPASSLFHHFSPASNASRDAGASDVAIASAAMKPARAASGSQSLSTRAQAEAINDAVSPFDVPLTRFEAVISTGSEDADLKPGTSGDVKIFGPSRSLGVRAWQSGRDWFRSQIWW